MWRTFHMDEIPFRLDFKRENNHRRFNQRYINRVFTRNSLEFDSIQMKYSDCIICHWQKEVRINKPLAFNNYQEETIYRNTTKTEPISTKYQMDSMQSETINELNANDIKRSSCSHANPCEYCCKMDLFVTFCFVLIDVFDTCLRIIYSMVSKSDDKLGQMLCTHTFEYQQQTRKFKKFIAFLCVCFVGILFIEVRAIRLFLMFILKPLSNSMCIQIHNLLFKITSALTLTDHDQEPQI